MKYISRVVSFSVVLFLSPAFASAVTLAPGDIIVMNEEGGSLLRIDPATGDRTVISGCVDSPCSEVIGAGLAFHDNASDVEVGPDGFVLVSQQVTVFRVDPATGDRTVVSGCSSEP